MNPKITVVIHTYNAAAHLDRVLRAVSAFDEILVADMESTDNTGEIARSHGARVITYPKLNYSIPEPYRQKAIDAASGNWILVVDADEIVPAALRDYLLGEIARDPATPRAFRIPRRNFFMGRQIRCAYPDYVLRFFPRRGTTWATTIHSLPVVNCPIITIPKSRTDMALIHLANESCSGWISKMNRYTDMELTRRRPKFNKLKIFYEPQIRFLKSYVLKGGFRDGWPGFIRAVDDSFYRFTILAKLTEEKIGEPDEALRPNDD